MLHQFFTPKPYLFYFLLVFGLLIYAYSFHLKTTYKSLPHFISFFLLLFARIPIIFKNVPLNPDESMQLAQALSIKRYAPVFDSWDGNTIGPLDTYLIMIPHALGFPLDFSTLHLMAILFQFAFLLVVFKSLNLVFNKNAAFWGTLPFLIWFVFTQHYDFLHYASELPPLLMLSFCTLIYFKTLKNPLLSNRYLVIQGILAALIPFAKLQAVPPLFIIMIFTVNHFFIYFDDFKEFLKKFLFIFIGGISVLLFITALTSYWGVFDDLLLYYFEGNLFHEAGGAKQPIYQKIINHFDTTADLHEFRAVLIYLLLFLLIFVWNIFQKKASFFSNLLFFIVVLMLFSVYAIGKSGFRLYHYYNFMMLPMALLAGFLSKDFSLKPLKSIAITLGLLLIFSYPVLPNIVGGKDFYKYPYTGRKMEISEVSKGILRYAKAGEPLVVWGWMQDYYVETQMPQGTNDNHSIRCFTYSLVSEHRKRYLKDLEKNKPPVIVDAVAPGSFMMTDQAEFGLQKFPELQAYIQKNYDLVETINQNGIYIRKK